MIFLTKDNLEELRNTLLLVDGTSETVYLGAVIYLYIDSELKVRYYTYNFPNIKSFSYQVFNNSGFHNHWVSDTEKGATVVKIIASNVSPAEADQAREKHHKDIENYFIKRR